MPSCPRGLIRRYDILTCQLRQNSIFFAFLPISYQDELKKGKGLNINRIKKRIDITLQKLFDKAPKV